jgi:hypothetical protein
MNAITQIAAPPEIVPSKRHAHRPRRLLLRIAGYAAFTLAIVVGVGLLGAGWYLRPAYSSLDQELTYRMRS